jgi:AmiR/NasT family two-component response regulator
MLRMNSVVAAGGELNAKPAGSLAACRSESGGIAMRVWLAQDRPGDDPAGIEALLTQFAARAETGVMLLAVRAVGPNLIAELRAHRPDVIVTTDAAWLDGPWVEDVFNLGPAILAAVSIEQCERVRALAELHPVSFLPEKPSSDSLWSALVSALASQRRHAHAGAQLARIQQRLDDRIIIERAKGVLVQRLGVSEEDAYKRLRVLSRRQRRQIRDIAQSLLDTQALLLPGSNGFFEPCEAPTGLENGKESRAPQS